VDGQIRAVDRGQPAAARGDQDPHPGVVVGVAAGVPGRLRADLQRPHAEAGHEIGRAEHQRGQAAGRRGDGIDLSQPAGVLDLCLDADPARL
jgi:hypothetical protein